MSQGNTAPPRLALEALSLPSPRLLAPNHIFVHPGALNNIDDLNFAKTQISLGHQPWSNKFEQLKLMATPGTFQFEWIDSKNHNTAEAAQYAAKKAYANALAWFYSGEDTFAKQGVALLADWQKLKGFNAGVDQDKLLAGWLGALIGPAAEILSLYEGWALSDQDSMRAMFRRAFYPHLLTMSSWNGNVDLTQIDALLNIAVFNGDVVAFNTGLARLHHRNRAYFYLDRDEGVAAIAGDFTDLNAFWHKPRKWQSGLTQETCRDNNHHTQYALASVLHAAEVAWNQGVDVYDENAQRYTAVMELMASQLMERSMFGMCDNDKPTHNVFSTWELGYNHYHNRQGILLPNTRLLINKRVRPRSRSAWNIFYETLSFAK